MISLGSEIINDLAAATSREWLETNGLGGFSSATIIGLNTRRYHGLLTATTNPPVGRIVMLSKLEETLVIDGKRYELSANQYPGVVHPSGYRYQTGFKLDPFPAFTFDIEGRKFTKSIFMVQGENTVVVQYHFDGELNDSVQLEIRPLVAFRDYHSTTHENNALNSQVQLGDRRATIRPYSDLPALHFAYDPCQIDTNGFWYRTFQYAIEQERGLDFTEDLFSPLKWTFDLTKTKRVRMVASTKEHEVEQVDDWEANERTRRGRLFGLLQSAADQFIVCRGQGKTVVAGYHWFSDWGRDTMIAVPGLLLTTGKHELAKSVLLEFAKYVDKGMLPNRFPDAGETPEYNTVDATLWFFETVRALLEKTNDHAFVKEHLYKVLKDIIDWHVRGTRYNIHVDDDGLLESGEPGVQLTWMDAKVGDHVITPRHGKPVEIQALWYNALRVMQELAAKFDDIKKEALFCSMADRARESFNRLFWNETSQCLFDVVHGEDRDASIRPNQVIAIGLKHSMVTTERAGCVLRVVERELLTPRGLRTLSPSDPQYRGRYIGDGGARDSVYHQGTVWPWLMGYYFTAFAKTFGKDEALRFGRDWFAQFEEHLTEAGLGQVSEIFDGDAPHAPRGCIAQAWSVSELLRIAAELG
jgi:predicted glycogen debranching enzyme